MTGKRHRAPMSQGRLLSFPPREGYSTRGGGFFGGSGNRFSGSPDATATSLHQLLILGIVRFTGPPPGVIRPGHSANSTEGYRRAAAGMSMKHQRMAMLDTQARALAQWMVRLGRYEKRAILAASDFFLFNLALWLAM